jgi:NAD(P)-dependent dehydrogenase (short-subunit alcohol dehydrogenase family)
LRRGNRSNPRVSDKRGNLIITGAAGDIGRETARLLSEQGFRLFLVDRDEVGVNLMAADLPNSVPIAADAAHAESMAEVVQRASIGRLDAMVLAAGTEGPLGPLEDCSDDAFDEVMALNVRSVWLGLKHCLPTMKRQRGGSIVVLSSISGVMASPLLAPYAASKHAVVGLVRTAAREAAAYNVRVNAVCPAPVASEMMRRIDAGLAKNFPERLGGASDASKSVPMQRYAAPAEIAQSIAFLCSDASSYCSGSAFMVDGGISCR